MNGLTRDIFAVVSYFSLLIKLLENKANIQKKETDIFKQFTNMINADEKISYLLTAY